ncbi:hypothetical protein [Halomarina oriensis]|uniref:Phage portal protein n=1 Tax=Halomarina oriensis TaxID=671145 RepID=A0A6B0GQX2_9EURY|nr:hypothetical protein [Halomarina oriensis]MWG36481.1 hypothetical protein [Halomarina oriensis]
MSYRDRFRAALAAATDAVPSPTTRSPAGRRFYSAGSGIDRDKPPKDAYDLYRQQAKTGLLVPPAIDTWVSEVCRPGAQATAENDDLRDDLNEWAATCAFYAGEADEPLDALLRFSVYNYFVDGEPLIEHVWNDPSIEDDEQRKLLSLKPFDPKTVRFLTYEGTSILVRPENKGRPQTAGGLQVDDAAPTNDREEYAAFVQYPEGNFGWDERNRVPLSQNDVTRIPRKPTFDARTATETHAGTLDSGSIRGTSLVESISEEEKRLRARLQDYNGSIAGMAYPRLKVQFEDYQVGEGANAEVVKWDDPDIKAYMGHYDREEDDQQYSPGDNWVDPGGKFGSPPGVDTEVIPGQVPDIDDSIQTSIDLIASGLGVPKYRIGYADDLNRRISEELADDFQRDVLSVRRLFERKLSPIFELKAEEFAREDDTAYGEEDLDGVGLSIATDETDSVVRDEEFDAEKFRNLMQGLSAWADSSAKLNFPTAWVADELNVALEEYDEDEEALQSTMERMADQAGVTAPDASEFLPEGESGGDSESEG